MRIGPETVAKLDAAWPEIIGKVSGGELIRVALADAGVSADSCRQYRLERPEREKEWQLAREQSADAFAEQVADIASNPGPDPATARVRIDAYRWLASKRAPKVYSDRQTMDLNVRTVDLTRIIQDANARLAAQRALGHVVEGAVVRAALPATAGDAW